MSRNRLRVGQSQFSVVGEQRPDDAGVLGGDRDAGAVVATTLTHRERPARQPILTALGGLQHGTSAQDQQSAQVGIATPSDVAEPGLAAGGVLPWHQPEPGGELPSLANSWALPTLAMIAEALSGPTP